MTCSASGASTSDDSLAFSVDSERETTPAEDRERINRLEIAVTWIKQAVVSIHDHGYSYLAFTKAIVCLI